MGRKRKGRAGGYVHPSKGRWGYVDPDLEKYLRDLEREGQKEQFAHAAVGFGTPPSGVSSKAIRWDTSDFYVFEQGWSFPAPRDDFSKWRNEPGYRDILYHGTSTYAAARIMLQGFRLPNSTRSGMFGCACYVTPDLSKAVGYTDGEHPIILVVEAYLGRIRLMDQADNKLNALRAQEEGFDTAFGKSRYTRCWSDSTLNYNEYAVYDPTRIRPRFLLEYKRVRSATGK